MKKINHYIIAPSSWGEDKLKFRRHRIAEYLLNRKDTNAVYWIYPISVHSSTNLKEYYRSLTKNIVTLDNGIQSVGLFDIKGFFKHNSNSLFSDKKILKRVFSNASKDCFNYLWYTHPAFSWLIEDYNWDKITYDCSDLWTDPFLKRNGLVGYLENIRTSKVVNSEKNIINRSNKITTTSRYLSNKITQNHDKQALIIENGVEFDLFTNEHIEQEILNKFDKIPSPRLGFVGGLKHKIDFELLYETAVREKGYSIVLVGPIPKNQPKDLYDLLALDNVYYLGPVEADKVPQYMKCLDIGLLPYKEIEYNKAISPLKLFEYIAAGIPCIGCGLPITTKYEKENMYKHIPRDLELFIKTCNEFLDNNNSKLVKMREQEAEKHSWDKKLMEIYDYSQS
ncbi:glycosyltransferase [Paenibacillus alvei]